MTLNKDLTFVGNMCILLVKEDKLKAVKTFNAKGTNWGKCPLRRRDWQLAEFYFPPEILQHWKLLAKKEIKGKRIKDGDVCSFKITIGE